MIVALSKILKMVCCLVAATGDGNIFGVVVSLKVRQVIVGIVSRHLRFFS